MARVRPLCTLLLLLAGVAPGQGRPDEPSQPGAGAPAQPDAAAPAQAGPVDQAAPTAADQARIEAGVQQEMQKQQQAYAQRQKKFRERVRLVPHYLYLEDSYIDYFFPRAGPAGDRPLTFEAQAATHLFLVNQWDKVERMTSPGAMASVMSWDVSFVLHLRMVQDHSAPVRPPSYMPAMHLQWFGLWKPSRWSVHELETEVGLTHHSNGQQQCPFVADQEAQASPSPKAECRDPDQLAGPLNHNVNYRSGDFSTSYATIGLHYAFITLDSDRYMASRYSIGAVYQQNFVAGQDGVFGEFPGAIPSDQASLYGIHRAKVEGLARWHVGLPWTDLAGILTASASEELMWNTSHGIPGNRTIAELSYTIDGFHGLGVFVRGFSGQDDMNILYAAGRTNMLALGLIWNTSPAVRYLFGEGQIPGE